MFRPAASRSLPISALLCALAVLSPAVSSNDSEVAGVRWSLLGDNSSNDSFDSEQAAVRAGCEQLRKQPPRSVNSVTKIGRCGDNVSATANARNFRVSYTLLAHDKSLDHETRTDSSFLIQRKAWCPSAQYPYLREDDGNRFRYSCWRCPTTELKAQAPRFVDGQHVRWFRPNQCPLDLNPQLAENGQPLTLRKWSSQTLPLATRLTAADHASFRLLRDAPYGRIAEIQLGTGERIFFIGDGSASAVLTAAQPQHGSVQEKDGNWLWLHADKTEYRFGAETDGLRRIDSKRGRDGQLWRYDWQPLTAGRWQLNALQDSKQRYQFRYDRSGKVSSIIMQAAGQRERVATLTE